ATRRQGCRGGRRAGGPGQGQTLGVSARRFLGGGTGVLGRRHGRPAANADHLAGTLGGALVASLAGSVAGAETVLGDVAAGLEALWEPAGIGRRPGSREAVGPLGWKVAGAGKD